MRPLKAGDPTEFWAAVWGVPSLDGAPGVYGKALSWHPPYVYYTHPADSIPLHGNRLRLAREEEVLGRFPVVIDAIAAEPDAHMSVAQLAALLGASPDSVEAGIAELRRTRDEIEVTSEMMQSFLAPSREAFWDSMMTRKPELGFMLGEEQREVGAYIQSDRVFWVCLLLEAAHFTAVLLMMWLPAISTKGRRYRPLSWGLIPLVLLLPYLLGYCHLALTSIGPAGSGGALYPWVLVFGFRRLRNFTPAWDYAILDALPHPLAALNPCPVGVISMSGGAVGPTPVLIPRIRPDRISRPPFACTICITALVTGFRPAYGQRRVQSPVMHTHPLGRWGSAGQQAQKRSN